MTRPDTASAPSAPARPRGRLHRALAAVRANPTGRVALKLGVGILGLLVVGLGIALIPLPGPGWAIVILGLAIWAVEFVWARHLLRYTRRQVGSWSRWVAARPLPLRLLLGAAGLSFLAAVLWLSLRLSFGIDLVAVARNLLAKH